MITQRQYIKAENPVALGASHFRAVGRRSSSTSSTSREADMPMKLDERLNELESNAVNALLSLGEVFVSQAAPYRTQVKKQPEVVTYTRPLQPQHLNAHHPPKSVITKAEPILTPVEPNRGQHSQLLCPPQITPPLSIPSNLSHELGTSHGSNNVITQQSTIKFAASPMAPNHISGLSVATPSVPISSNTIGTPVSIHPISSTSSPVISTIFYQIPATAAGSATNGTRLTTGTAVMPSSFTIIPAANGRGTVIPLPMVTGSATPLVKIEPGTSANGVNNGVPINWNNIQVVKMQPRGNNEKSGGMTTYGTLAPLTSLPKDTSTTTTPTKLLPSPGKGDGKTSSVTPTAPAANGKTPTKSRARRRSQTTPKGQSRNSRASSSATVADYVVSPPVDGLPNIVVDGHEISREIWAKAFLQNDIIHAAGTLFNALFSSDEIKNCTLNGRNGTRQLCPEKRLAIFRIVAWMKNKCQDPYSFNQSPEETKILNRDEQQMIEKKVFVERRYQTSRKIRDLPNPAATPVSTTASPSSLLPSVAPTIFSSVKQPIPSPPMLSTTNLSIVSSNKSLTTPKKCAPIVAAPVIVSSSTTPPDYRSERRDSSGSFSSICSSSGDDKGIPKIALLQSSDIIANYFQSTEPLPITAPIGTPLIHLNNQTHDGPPPMKMQKVG